MDEKCALPVKGGKGKRIFQEKELFNIGTIQLLCHIKFPKANILNPSLRQVSEAIVRFL